MSTLINTGSDQQISGDASESGAVQERKRGMSDPRSLPAGSTNRLAAFLHELVELAGQDLEPVPVLELQLGDTLTRTSVGSDIDEYLLITALLPACNKPRYAPAPCASLMGELEFLWHSDEGRYIAVCKVPAAELPDERSIMDAILATSENAMAWFVELQGEADPKA
jgi:hypothetical protein